jgi:uncharacterized protein (DUF305 family)
MVGLRGKTYSTFSQLTYFREETMKFGKSILYIASVILAICVASGRVQAAPFDQAFIDAMVPHHQSALMMAQMAVTKAPHATVKNLARRILRDQQKEIAQLKAWRKVWYGSAEVPMDMMKGSKGALSHDAMNHGAMPGKNMADGKMRMMSGRMMGLPMKMEMDMGRLMRLNGRAFERDFLRMMVPHHASAISMAQEALDVTARPQIRALSHKIIDAQAKEIGEMRALHHRWYGSM